MAAMWPGILRFPAVLHGGKQFGERTMSTGKKILDFDYEEVLDLKTRELIRVGCAVAVGCPT
jgi:alkylhydroperoxidase/carboxymuconolactone decarboxylase family protein YurZ